jgi:hypothetical protein
VETAVFYGQLQRILVCELPDDAIFRYLRGKTCLLALVIPCNTDGRDATKEPTTYTTVAAPVITDLCAIKAVVGRVQSRGKWTVVDRSREIAHAAFAEEGDETDELSD